MDKEQIKEGDTVRLKSGGLLMTVESIKDARANCTWFDNGKLFRDNFAIVALEKDEDED